MTEERKKMYEVRAFPKGIDIMNLLSINLLLLVGRN